MTHVVHNPQRAKPFIERNSERIRRAVSEGSVLDVGCYEGRHVLFLASIGIKAVGIDKDEDAIAAARQRAKHLGLENRAQFMVADVTHDLDGAYGAVICTEVMQDIPRGNWGSVLTAMRSITTPGGIHLVSGYVNEYADASSRAFLPGQLDGDYREAGWNILASETDPTEFGQLGAITSLTRIIAQRP